MSRLRRSPVRIDTLHQKKRNRDPLVCVTCWDATTAALIETSQVVDLVLVGDSLATSVLGHPDTLSVTMAEMLLFTKAVSRGLNTPLLIADMPFGSYQLGPQQAVENALRFVKEGRAHGVKIEGGSPAICDIVQQCVTHGIPVLGHIGFTPQHLHQLSGYRVQGRGEAATSALVQAAQALEDAGAFAVVLEMTPKDVAARIQQALTIPLIGIGAGPHCDGQILVLDDLIDRHPPSFRRPRFSRAWVSLRDLLPQALTHYKEALNGRLFPTDDESFDTSC
jgi:3-methyl-2-oxobutanoate hydroxymethyltransferase